MTLQLNGTNRNGSPELTLSEGGNTIFAWSPFGGGVTRTGNTTLLPGFNGERQDPLSSVTHLGNGYRAYSPALRRFTCPDSESPFGVGGINPYAYCDHDPVNRTDPSGHGPITWLIRKTISLSVRLGIASEETADSMATGLTTAGAVETGTELAAQGATGISQQVAKSRGNFAAVRKLAWASLALGIAGGLGLAEGNIGQTVRRLRASSKSFGLERGSRELSDMFGPETEGEGYRKIADEGAGIEENRPQAQDSLREGGDHGTSLRSRTPVLRSPADDNLLINAEFSLSDRNGSVIRNRASRALHVPDNTRSFIDRMNEHGNISGTRPGSVVGEAVPAEHIMGASGRSAGIHPAGESISDLGELSRGSIGNGHYTPGNALLSTHVGQWGSQPISKLKSRRGATRFMSLP